MNLCHIVGATIVFAIIVFVWFIDRLKKRIARRCSFKGCGNTRVKRKGKIVLAKDEKVSFRSPQGRWRLFIRRVVKLTFTVCEREDKHEGVVLTLLVKIDYDPISVLHAYWLKLVDHKQYDMDDWPFVEATIRRSREFYLSEGGRRSVGAVGHLSLGPQSSDTPPLSLYSLFSDYLGEISEVIGGD